MRSGYYGALEARRGGEELLYLLYLLYSIDRGLASVGCPVPEALQYLSIFVIKGGRKAVLWQSAVDAAEKDI